MDAAPEVRTDKWLWAARVFKTRALALEACKAGHVRLGGATVKPGRSVRVGDVFVVQTQGPLRTLRVVGVSGRRVAPRDVATLVEDMTPPDERERSRLTAVEQVLSRPRGAGRPTKKERRQLDRWML